MQATGMDLPSKTMYDTFKGDIRKELGPLDPDWFEALTAQAFANDGNVSDQEDLCANQEGHFKTPFDKTAVDSQLFSTPKVFRHSRIVSPETEDEQSFTAEQEKETLPWMTTQSPCLFQMSKQGVEGVKYGGIHPQSQDSFDLLNTPHKSSVSYAKNISESLGAQINPDISWTSSFNTPPAIPSTLILSKHDESPCPVSLPEDKNVVLVRKLFPSLSNSSRLVSPKNSDLPSGHQGVVSPEPGQNPESHNCPQSSLNQSDCVWKQMLPDAIEDGEMRSTIASVLDGAEDVLSIFFTNSSSALRKVKTERIRIKQITQTKQHGCISTDISTTNNSASSEQRPADQDPGRLPSPPPVKTGDIGITQWSPLSLSEIPPCTVDTSCPDDGAATQVENNVLTEQLRSDFESGQLVRPPTKITDSGFTKKKRKFVYTVQSSKLQVQREDRPSQRMDSSPGIPDSGQKVNAKQLVNAPDEADCIRKNEMSEQGNLVEESLPHSVQAKFQDLDISQLSKDFAQDFSQMSEPGNLSKVAVQNVFSPSACLSAMKQTNQRERQAKLHRDCDGIRNRGSVSTTHQNNSICEGAVSDSGFQSGVGDIGHVTASSFVPPSSENNGQQWTGFKTDIYRTTPFPSTNKGSGKAHLDDILQEAGTDTKLCSTIKESRTLDPSEMCMESTSTQLHSSAKGTVDNVNCTPFNGQAHGSLPEKTTVSLPSAHASGFKTASNKGIQISSANLERAKRLFEETEGEQTLSNQPIKCVRSTKDELSVSHGSVKNTTSNSLQPRSSSVTFVDNSCQLTASQKADVTELCTLLEEADSQFEFTQFRTAKPRQHCPDNATSPPKIDKELDPDFLTGIDFDDSFNSDAEKQPTCDQMTLVSGDKTKNKTSVTSKSTGFSLPCAIKKENFSTEDVSSSSKHISEGSSGIVSPGSKSLHRSGHTEASKLDNKNALMLGVGFKTAGGNVLRVSKTCLNKARALFADLEENPVTCEKPQEKQSSKTDTKTWHKRSADNSTSTLLRHKVDRGPAVQHTEVVQHNVEIHNFVLKNTPALTKAASPHGTPSSTAKAPSSLPCTATSKNIGSISINELSDAGGFCTASGEKVFVSADAMKKAECLLNDIHTLEGANKQLKQKGGALKTGHIINQIQVSTPKSGGFQTASGKGVTISSEALKKAKSLLSECDEVEDKICAKPTHSKTPVPGPPPRNSGFLAASGKPVAFSSEALLKAKALFSDISLNAEIPAVSDTRNSDKKQDNVNNIEKIDCGFSTARGAKVHVSQKNLLKAKNLLKEFDDGSISAKATQEADAFFKDCDNQDSKGGMSINHWKSIAPVSGNGSEKKSLPKFKQDHKVTNFSEESGSGHTKLENMSMERIVNYEKMLDSDNMKIHKVVLKNTPDPDCSSVNKLSSSGGFCTASGKKVSVSDEAMTKAKSLLNENATFEDKQLKQKDTLPPQNAGFQTASGKGVAISSAALKKAKTLLSECEGVEDQIAAKPTHSKMPVPGPPPRNHGFLAASGKSVAFSTEALQKAKALFSDMDFSADVPAVSHKTKSEHKDARNDTEKIHCGFSTAGGAEVHVSQKNLLKAKNLFNDLTDVECHDSNSTGPADTHKLDILKVKDVKRASNSNLTTASERDIPANESAPQMVTSLQATDHENDTLQSSSVHDCIFMKDKAPTDAFKIEEGRITSSGVGSLHDNPREEMSTVLDYKINQTSSSGGSKVKRTEESSVLCFESFNLRGCTETQQRLLAQEALDCTKALLEDENLAGQRLSMTLENVPQRDNSKSVSVEEQRGRGKRHVKDPDITSQPPLKRRLLEEFDRTVEGPRGSTLHPEKSIPDGVMKDRRVFKYGVSLHANITRPHRTGNSYVETRIQKTPSQHSITGDGRSAHSKMPMFVPPFLKNTESRKNTVFKDSIRIPSAFVPPFKKQRTIVKESSSTPQEEEKLCHTVTPFNSNTYVPPTKTTQSTSDVTGNKSKEDIQMVALVDTTNDNLVNNEKIPVGCGSKGSSAEALRVEDTLFRSQDMFQDVHNIELARDMQHMRIRKKKRQTIRPLPGSLFLTKSSGVQRILLKAAVNGKPPARFTQKQLYGLGVHQHVCEVTSETAESFRFTLRHFVKQEAFIDGGGVQLADGGWLIPSNDGTAGKEEFYRALCDTPGVDPKLISEEWVYNHYRWIVWKQASMERSFPETMGSLCLTPEQVLLQLKYRYDVEVDHSRRPALRKIMEKDDTAAKTLVLCVCGIVSRGHSPKRHSCSGVKTPGADAKVENPSAVVWLTDGWYAIKAQLDEPLTAMLHKGRLAVGGKLIIHGAQLVGSQDACSPLEAPDSLMLKICANSSRPTRWHAKLGFHKDPRPFLLPVSSLYSNGGPVGCVDIIILRSYPIQWMERKPDGGVVFRSVRAEEKEARRYNNHKQKAMEVLFAKIQAEFEKEEKGNNKPQRRRRTISRQDIASLQDGEELYEAVGDDAAYLEAHLSEQQLEALHTYRRSQMDKKQAELQDRYRRALENAEDQEGSCPKRDVTPVWRVCIADSMDQPGSVYQLNLWRPPSDLQSLLKEGCRYKVYNLTTSDGKKHGGSTTVQLTGTKKTQLQDLQASQDWLSTHFQPRVSTHFVDLQNPEFQSLCGEVDLTGYVISIIDGQGFSPAFYLADGKLNFVKVRCFSSLAQSGLEDVVKPRVLLALSNLQLRGQSTSPTPVVYAGDLTVFSTNPKEVHLQESLSQLRNLVQGQENFFLTAEEKLSHLVKSDGLSSISSPALQARTPATDKKDTKSVTSQQPVRGFGSFTPVSRNPPATNCSTEKDPIRLKRRRALDYLSRIPSPPPLSNLGSVASPCVNKTFNPPRRSGTPSTLKTVQTPACKPVNSPLEDEWVNDEELAMIDTQALLADD